MYNLFCSVANLHSAIFMLRVVPSRSPLGVPTAGSVRRVPKPKRRGDIVGCDEWRSYLRYRFMMQACFIHEERTPAFAVNRRDA